jgi:hypothetical protein
MGYKQQAVCRGFLHDMYEIQNHKCYICKEEMPSPDTVLLKTQECTGVTLDHVVPRIKGGTKLAGNSLLAHGRCNSRKSDRIPTPCELTYLKIVNELLGWNGIHYLNTEKGKENQRVHEIQIKRRFKKADAIFVTPITRNAAAGILLSRKQYGVFRWRQKQKESILWRKRIVKYVTDWVSCLRIKLR